MLTGLCLLITETDLVVARAGHRAQDGLPDLARIFNSVFFRPATANHQAIGPWTPEHLSNKFGGRWGPTKPTLWRTHVLRVSGYFTVAEMQHRKSLRQHLLATAAALGIILGPNPNKGGHALSGDDRAGGNVSPPFLKNQNGPPAATAAEWNGGAGYQAAMIPLAATAGLIGAPPPFVALGMPFSQQVQPPPGQVAAAAPPALPPPVQPPAAPAGPPNLVPPAPPATAPQQQQGDQGDGEDEGSDADAPGSPEDKEDAERAARADARARAQVRSAAQQLEAEERYSGELIEGIDIYNPMLMADTWEELGLREGDERLL